MKSAGRPGTASRKGRAVKSSAGHTASDMALGASLAFSQEPDIEEVTPFPRVRGSRVGAAPGACVFRRLQRRPFRTRRAAPEISGRGVDLLKMRFRRLHNGLKER